MQSTGCAQSVTQWRVRMSSFWSWAAACHLGSVRKRWNRGFLFHRSLRWVAAETPPLSSPVEDMSILTSVRESCVDLSLRFWGIIFTTNGRGPVTAPTSPVDYGRRRKVAGAKRSSRRCISRYNDSNNRCSWNTFGDNLRHIPCESSNRGRSDDLCLP
ncbi:hypothetical protein EXIGLDRAFT_391739 [Exidia glandulosa HHB12029]|uniref:Uncharacterized protein n=1 Tax=Exidia glandulosa HHB12029 TaxID=1314781 RepID=A0A165BRM6_EXIGL|nr:hypothetical protein EXIGLDRAFT_391739 [Exidia glandulosa HHB12029]